MIERGEMKMNLMLEADLIRPRLADGERGVEQAHD
jgi:hypothetical protein